MKKTINLNNRFYTKEAIQEAAEAFGGICRVALAETDSNTTIELETKEENAEYRDIEKEFANHCLANMRR
jgi:hypothetical protein